MEFKRQTRQREAILRVLRGLKTHPTAPEVYELVRREIPRVSLGTVYRNLDALAEAGAVRRLGVEHAKARFDGDLSEHDHARCIDCDRIADVRRMAPGQVDFSEISRETGFEILGRRLEFVGVCPECQARRRSADARAAVRAGGAGRGRKRGR